MSAIYFIGWGAYFLGWEGADVPVPFAPVPVVAGAGAPRRFVLPPSMAIAAAKLAGDHDALLVIEAITASGILE